MQNSNYTQGEVKADSHELYILKPSGGRIKLGMAYVQAWGLTTHNTPIIDNEGLANAERLALCWNYHSKLVEVLTEILRFKPSIELVMGEALQYPTNLNTALDTAKQLLNQLNTKP